VSVGPRAALRELLVALESGSRPKGGVKGIESGVPSLGGEHLDGNGGFRLDRVRYVPREFAASMRRGKIAVGDVLVVKDGATTGKVALVRDSFPYKDAVVNEHVFLCRCDERVDPGYVFWYLCSAKGQREILSDFRGAAQGGISQRFSDLVQVPLRPIGEQRRIVAEVEKQFSRLDEAVANLKRVKANAQRFVRATIQALTASRSSSAKVTGTVADIAISLDNMREPVNKTERANRVGTIPYLGANGQTGWIDEARFDEELVLVVEDETFVGRKLPFSYYFSGKCWVNNHTHVLRARRELVLPKYLNLALSYYPFIPLTTGSTGRRKLTKAALMSAPIEAPDLATQHRIVAEVDRRLSIVRAVEIEVDANLTRASVLRQAVLTRGFT